MWGCKEFYIGSLGCTSLSCEDARSRSYSELLAALPSVGRRSEGFLGFHLKQALSNDTRFWWSQTDKSMKKDEQYNFAFSIDHHRTINEYNCCVIVYLLGCSSTDWAVLHFRNLIIILFIFITNTRIETLYKDSSSLIGVQYLQKFNIAFNFC